MTVRRRPGFAVPALGAGIRLTRLASPTGERLRQLERMDNEAFGPTGLRVYDLALIAHAGYVFEATLGSGECVGGCQLLRMGDAPDTLWLVGFYVLPEWRGCGIGTAFLRALLEELQALGAQGIRLTVEPGNEAAIRLYEGAGFRRLGDVPEAYGPGEDRHLLEFRP